MVESRVSQALVLIIEWLKDLVLAPNKCEAI